MLDTSNSGPVVFHPQSDETSKWYPTEGDFTSKYLAGIANLDEASKAKILGESAAILGNCTKPTTDAYSEAGLVVGYVQSGKTLSFTTIAALARDNGYGLVIVLTGITNMLKSQSVERLVDDLGLEEYHNEWKIFENPGSKHLTPNSSDLQLIKARLEGWNRWQSQGGMKRASVLVTLLKSAGRINNLANLLKNVNLKSVPTLIIDDESDQASPNLKSARNLKTGGDDESSTYSAINNLRCEIPRHTYLQYTATPQANLLAAKADVLSPAFARVITPGNGYTGGEFFFGDPANPNIRLLDDADTVRPSDLPNEPPESLQHSLASFWLASAVATIENHENAGKPATRSMMIQTSARVYPQRVYKDWALEIQRFWKFTLWDDTKASYPDVVEVFKASYEDLSQTREHLPTFNALLAALPDTIDETLIVEVNGTSDAEKNIQWYKSQFWILVGGMKLDRGFTVKGITTTYMPRSVTDNADTLQQRARFFGYHGSYSGLCRIFIASDSLQTFKDYLEHETVLRDSLIESQGKPLSAWKRSFVMSLALRKPTRANVIGIRLRSRLLTEGWVAPHYLHENADAIHNNVTHFTSFINFVRQTTSEEVNDNNQIWRDRRVNSGHHRLYRGVPMASALDFILGTSMTNQADTALQLAMSVAMARTLEDAPDELVDVVLMNGYSGFGLDGRVPDKNTDKINNLFIGRSPKTASSAAELNYIGDRDVKTANTTLHLRILKVRTILVGHAEMIEIPWLALHANRNLEIHLLEEEVN